MKKTKFGLMILMIIVAINGYTQVKNKDVMVKKIFTVLKNKDENGFVKLFPDAVTMKAFVSKIGGKDLSDNEYFEKLTDSSLQQQFRHDFERIIEKGKLKGVNWSAAEFISYISDSAILDEETMKVTSLTGKMYFNSEGKEYFLRFEEVIWFPEQGWYGVQIRRIDEKKNENQPQELNDFGEGIVVADSIAAPSEKFVPKPKPPVKKAPAKAKTTKPANK